MNNKIKAFYLIPLISSKDILSSTISRLEPLNQISIIKHIPSLLHDSL